MRLLTILALLSVIAGCLLAPQYALVTGRGTFILAIAGLGIALGFLTASLESWFARPTHGRGGKLGMGILWLILRMIFGAVFVVLGVTHVLPYATALYVCAAVLLVLDTLFFLS